MSLSKAYFVAAGGKKLFTPLNMENLRISIVQTDLVWEDRAENLSQFGQLLGQLCGQTDLILLPEMFTTGFSMDAARLAEPEEGPTRTWMVEQAAKTGAVIVGSYIVEEGGGYYNRLLWVSPDGQIARYDKRHLFSLAGEHLYYRAGQTRLIAELKGWRICPLICYDLRFPVWSRNTEDFDLLIYIANFPARRAHAWKSLLVARAIENQCYTIGVNRTGMDGNGHDYSGDSCLLDFEGQYLAVATPGQYVATVALEASPMLEFRKRFPFLVDRDDFFLQ